jgi:hypothetical protein
MLPRNRFDKAPFYQSRSALSRECSRRDRIGELNPSVMRLHLLLNKPVVELTSVDLAVAARFNLSDEP